MARWTLRWSGAIVLLAMLVTVATQGCGDDSSGSDGDGSSAGSGASGTGGDGSGGLLNVGGLGQGASSSGGSGAGKCQSELLGVIRDFRDDHPDFEAELGTDKGIVQDTLGPDGKPVYAGDTPTTHGQGPFDQWYRDVDGVNLSLPQSILLTESGGGTFTFSSDAFFPIDDQGFGNQGREHNFHFTYEIRTEFQYLGGEVFTFTGDDDLFTFINGRLAIDLGGVHGPESQSIDLDAQASQLGITVGEVYSLDFFFAERHTTQSNFRIDTTINCFTSVPAPS